MSPLSIPQRQRTQERTTAREVADFIERQQRRHRTADGLALAIANQFPGLAFDTFAGAVCIFAAERERAALRRRRAT